MNIMNQPRPEIQDKVPIDNNSIMTYEDCLKDLNATSAVVYEELNQQPQPNNPPQQPQMQQPVITPNNPPPSHNDVQMIEQQAPMMNNIPPNYQPPNIPSTPNYYEENRYYPQQFDNSQVKPPPPPPKSHETFLDKSNINDIALIILAYVIINNKVVTNMIAKQFPSLFIEDTPTTFGVVFQGFLLVFIWILTKKIISQYVNKM